jgi:NAD(P)-dependent dehydrogenase (short-subunit alcohol dehydrogenase family)
VKLNDKVIVVTGGAHGIGAAMLRRFHREKPRALVVADRDLPAAEALAKELGGLAVACDVGREADLVALVERATREYGTIDLFVSNAGIATGGDVDQTDDEWRRIIDINLMAHVWAARALLPAMVARGGGYLVATASAAGLLSMVGSAPYSVTKHAAVALAEWLSITYGDLGIGVSCLCPQAVSTNLGATSMREVAGLVPPAPDTGAVPSAAGAGSVSQQASVDGVLTPDQVAASVLAAVAADRFLILPHPEVATYECRRATDRDRWLSGMRRLHSRLAGRG